MTYPAIPDIGTAGQGKYIGGGLHSSDLDAVRTLLLNNSGSALPAASVTYRGKTFTVEGAAGYPDITYVCVKEADGGYAWAYLDAAVSLGVFDPMDYGATGDDTADDTTPVQDAIDAAELAAASNGGAVVQISKKFKVTSALTIDTAGVTLTGGGQLRQATNATGLLLVTASDTTVDGITLVGPRETTVNTSEVCVWAYGPDLNNYLSNINIRNCEMHTSSGYGVRLNFVTDFAVTNNYIHAVHSAGISAQSSEFGVISLNRLEDIGTPATGSWDTGGVYGIAITRLTTAELNVYPRSRHITVIGNIVRDVINWEALDTHAGDSIAFIGNTVYNCKLGIGITKANDAAGDATYAPLNCSAVGNTLISGVTDGSYSAGITFSGAYNAGVIEYGTGVIKDNIVVGFGLEDTEISGGVYLQTTEGLVVSGNRVAFCSPHAVCLVHTNENVTISGNTFEDFWSDTHTSNAGIFTSSSGLNTGLIFGNIVNDAGAASAKTSSNLNFVAIGSGTDEFLVGLNDWADAGSYVDDAADAAALKSAFFDAAQIAQPTGVAVTAVGIHAALVSLGLITA